VINKLDDSTPQTEVHSVLPAIGTLIPHFKLLHEVCIRLYVHDIADTIQMFPDEVPVCIPSKHGDTFQSIRPEYGLGNQRLKGNSAP